MIENVTVSVTENGELENMDSRVGTQVGRSLSAVKVTKNPVRIFWTAGRKAASFSRIKERPAGRCDCAGWPAGCIVRIVGSGLDAFGLAGFVHEKRGRFGELVGSFCREVVAVSSLGALCVHFRVALEIVAQ